MGPFQRSCLVILVSIFILLVQAHGHGGSDDDDSAGDENSTGDLHDRSLIRVKIWCLFIFLASTFAGGISPYFYRWNESFLLLGTQFAGGVFFGTAMMHFLSDSSETFEELTSKSYPFAFLLASVGYLLTMLGDCVVGMVVGSGKVKSGGGDGVDVERGAAVDAGHVHAVVMKASSLGDTILLIAALCFHSVFEGIAVGVADNKADAWRNLWTISLHKVFAAIAMGIALLKMLPSRPFLITAAYAFAFAISSPIGVGIGIAIDATTQGAVADWIYCISMGIATGVFIYVAINHLINKGYKPQSPSYFDTPFFKFLAVLAGIGVIGVVMIWD